MTVVKICGLTNVTDARWAWHCGADLLGFIFVESTPRWVSPDTAAHIIGALRSEGCHLRAVGVFADASLDCINRITQHCGLDLVQWHHDSPPPEPAKLTRPLILAQRVRGRLAWVDVTRTPAWAYLLDTYHPGRLGGTGQAWAWDELTPGGTRPERLIVAGGLTPDNVALAICQARPWGVDVSSGVEATPGHKDSGKVQRFIDSVRQVDLSLKQDKDSEP